ncbi:MAG TPA: phosphoribosyltransferase family protein [Actinomycetota bacterium]|nr:phosphoribosyltransferase family protein [Actinomycetota bacterium]
MRNGDRRTWLIFADRADAGERLGRALAERVGPDAVVLAIPRGGVIVGEAVARAIAAPLDVVVPRKIGAPGNPELGVGAIAPGVRVLDSRMLAGLRVSDEYLEREIAAQESEIERRQHAYREGRPPAEVRGHTAVVVDDGVATGGTATAALRWARAQGATRVILAVPVAPSGSLERLAAEADEVIVLETPEPFFAVGEWYRDFDQTSDREVVSALGRSAGSRS